MLILDSLLIGGIRFVLGKVANAVDAEMNDDSRLRERLLEAQMRHELGEIDDAELAETERDVLARLREIKEARGEGAAGPISFQPGMIVEAEVGGDAGFLEEEPPAPPPKKRRRSAPKK